MTKEAKQDVAMWVFLSLCYISTCVSCALLFCIVYLDLQGEPWEQLVGFFVAASVLSFLLAGAIAIMFLTIKKRK